MSRALDVLSAKREASIEKGPFVFKSHISSSYALKFTKQVTTLLILLLS
jgi:hypothetical protein